MQTASYIRTTYLFLSILICSSCHSTHKDGTDHTFADIRETEAAKYMGAYSGSFNKGIITLVLNYISGKTVSGYNVHKGLRRNINGEVTRDGGTLNFVLKEPGDNPYDGTFYFSLDTASLKLNGRWVPLDSSKISAKKLALTRRKTDPTESYEVLWHTIATGDSSLLFKQDGTCEFTFYERPQDSTSQLITIRGNYISNKDTFKIEWQKNSSLPAPMMKMVRYHVRSESDPDMDAMYLRGHGLEFAIFDGD